VKENSPVDKKIREETKNKPILASGEEISDKKLILAVQDGDKKAFSPLIRRYQKRLFRFVYGLVGSFDAAEDIVQETFIKAFNGIETFNTEYDFYPWLATIARNTAYNNIHREERKESLNSLQEKGYDPASADLGPFDRLLDQEGQKRFYKAVKALPVKYRSVFVLRHFEDMDYSAIASYLKIPPGTVDSRLYRARKLLLEELKDLM